MIDKDNDNHRQEPHTEAPMPLGRMIAFGAPGFAGAGMAIPIAVLMPVFYSDVVLAPLGTIALLVQRSSAPLHVRFVCGLLCTPHFHSGIECGGVGILALRADFPALRFARPVQKRRHAAVLSFHGKDVALSWVSKACGWRSFLSQQYPAFPTNFQVIFSARSFLNLRFVGLRARLCKPDRAEPGIVRFETLL